MPEYLYKVIVIGDNNVGKTSLLNRYVNNRYVDNCKSTVGVDFLLKVVHYDDSTLRMQFWDIAGQEYSKQLSRSYYKDANACIIVFDITKRTTFDSVIQWKEEVDQKLGQIPTLILSNKYDLIMDPQNPRISCIDDMDLDTLKDSIHATGCFQVSAKTGYQVSKSMKLLEKILLGVSKPRPRKQSGVVEPSDTSTAIIETSSSSCCN